MSDYDQLQADIASFLVRTDLTATIPTFITLAEREMNRVVNTREQVVFATFNITATRCLLPDDFRSVESFRVQSKTEPLEFITPDQMDAKPVCSGIPTDYAIIGDSFTFWPQPGDDPIPASLRYRSNIEPLADVGSNWLSQKHYDAYLYGSLKHSAGFLVEDERLQTWGSLFNGIVQQINADGQRQVQGQVLRQRTRTATP